MIFREQTEAELEVEKGILDHLKQRIKGLQPLLDQLNSKRIDCEDDIKRLEKELVS